MHGARGSSRIVRGCQICGESCCCAQSFVRPDNRVGGGTPPHCGRDVRPRIRRPVRRIGGQCEGHSGVDERAAPVQIADVPWIDIAKVVVTPIGEETGLRDDREAVASNLGYRLLWSQCAVLDAVPGDRPHLIERQQQNQQVLP